jgi:hypothetical protein
MPHFGESGPCLDNQPSRPEGTLLGLGQKQTQLAMIYRILEAQVLYVLAKGNHVKNFKEITGTLVESLKRRVVVEEKWGDLEI